MITANDNPNNLSRIADLEAEVIRLQAVNEAQERSIDELQRLFNGMREAHGKHDRIINDILIQNHMQSALLKTLSANDAGMDEDIETLFEVTGRLQVWAEDITKWLNENGDYKPVKVRKWWGWWK